MKRRVFTGSICVTVAALVMAAALFISSCSGYAEPENPRTTSVTVTVVSGDGFTADRSQQKVSRGDDAVFMITMEDDMCLTGCSYENSEITETDDGTVLTLYNVLYSVRVSLDVYDLSDLFVIKYDLNGGSFTDGTEGDTFKTYMEKTHKRANTSTALNVARDGYTQTGWNTERDGSGEHIGLGSRVTYESGMTLYAEWAEWTDAKYFEYSVETDGCACLTLYSGERFVSDMILPGEIGGYTVDTVAANFATNLYIGSLVLPRSIERVEDGAFVSCTVQNLTLSDSLSYVSDRSFSLSLSFSSSASTVHSVHINAVDAPAHLSFNDNSRFAENMDNLILYEGKPRLLFYAGCSMSYGLQSPVVEEAFPEYQVLDLGVIGGTNAYFQMQIIREFLREGDVFVHAPEGYSPYQLMTWIDTDSRIFTLVEGNYDLMSYADVADMEGFFDSFMNFLTNRKELEPGTYEDCLTTYNDYGDIIIERPYVEDVGERKTYSNYMYNYDLNYYTYEGYERLSGLYSDYTEKGVRVLYSYAPFNRVVLEESRYAINSVKYYESFVRGYARDGHYTVISSLDDYLYDVKYFYDEDYHLNDEGARLRTLQLIKDLSSVI